MSRSWFHVGTKNSNIQSKCKLPAWFIKWWSQHGPTIEILSNELKASLNYFKTIYQVSEYNSRFPMTVLLFSKYIIPWIVKWQYKIENDGEILTQ
jgi:hypothetical protein